MQRVKTATSAAGLLLVLAVVGCSKPPATVTLYDYGIYNGIITTTGDWKQGTPVSITSIDNLVHKETTTRIPARPGVYWGFRAIVTNKSDKPVEVVSLQKHPPITTPDGKTSSEDLGGKFTLPPGQTSQTVSMWFFIASCPHEFVPGQWTWEIDIDGKAQMIKTFDVYKP
jgi:hypothetical protein